MDDEKNTLYGGQRGGGKIFALELKIDQLNEELKNVKKERDRYAREIARVSASDDLISQQIVIRISYTDLLDPYATIDAILRELQTIMKP